VSRPVTNYRSDVKYVQGQGRTYMYHETGGVYNRSVNRDLVLMHVGPAYMRPDLSGSVPTLVVTNLAWL
jgi:hypothetical protein